MTYVPKNQISTIQEIIYPQRQIPMTFLHHKQNLQHIKDTQDKNRLLNEEKENYIERM
jgi:hypothetical protein